MSKEKVESLHQRIAELEAQQVELSEQLAKSKAALVAAEADKQHSQDYLVRQEKLIALGQLMAGIAHEINGPLGAVKASADSIMDVYLPSQLLLQKLVQSLPNDTLQQVYEICNQIANTEGSLGSREERKYRAALTRTLEEVGVEDADYKARQLVSAGFQGDIVPYLNMYQSEVSSEVANYIYSFGQVLQNLRNILTASEKARRIVFALKSYAYNTQVGGEMGITNVIQNVDTVLVLYNNQLKYGFEVNTHFESKSTILGYADELTQVWTNIIHNAIQAMNGSGVLDISIKDTDDNFVQVCITDNGPGIPEDVQPRIFEQFFTTKVQGEGTGLGLDICKKIIEKHNGKIYFETEPGRTSFFIELPIFERNVLR